MSEFLVAEDSESQVPSLSLWKSLCGVTHLLQTGRALPHPSGTRPESPTGEAACCSGHSAIRAVKAALDTGPVVQRPCPRDGTAVRGIPAFSPCLLRVPTRMAFTGSLPRTLSWVFHPSGGLLPTFANELGP